MSETQEKITKVDEKQNNQTTNNDDDMFRITTTDDYWHIISDYKQKGVYT